MEELPSEIINAFFCYMTIPSIKSFRRTCKSYAAIGETYLFHKFEFRLYPNRHRLYQLEQLSLHPSIAPRLRVLSSESGVPLEYADYRYWRAQVYEAEKQTFSRGLITEGITHEEYISFHSLLDARFTPEMGTKYELYRWHFDEESSAMTRRETITALSRAIRNLSSRNIDFELRLVMQEPQITLEDLTSFDADSYAHDLPQNPNPRWRVQKRRLNCVQHFLIFLQAALTANWSNHTLATSNLPCELFVALSNVDESVIRSTLQKLSCLKLDLGELPHSDWLARGGGDIYHRGRHVAARVLAGFLVATRNLEALELRMPSHSRALYSTEIFEPRTFEEAPLLWLDNLQSLSLAQFECSFDKLEGMLRLARNVQSLKLDTGKLLTGSMIRLIEILRGKRLKKVCLKGDWEIEEDRGEWHSHDNTSYTLCRASHYEGPYATKGLRHQIQSYIIDGGECPLPEWTEDGRNELIWEMQGDTSWHFIPSPRQ